MADEHEHDYKLKIGMEDIGALPAIFYEPVEMQDLHIYAECECGAELDAEEIEEIINAKRH